MKVRQMTDMGTIGRAMKRGGMVGLLAGALALAACNGDTDPPPMDETMDMPMEGMGGMEMDPAMMERHADQAEAIAAEVREHVERFRALPAGEQYERMGEQGSMLARMLGLIGRQMHEMSMGMPMDDEQMGAMMGMSAEEHRRMMQEMEALRSEMEELQTAPMDELGERMGPHLERMEAMARMMEEMAAAMRTM